MSSNESATRHWFHTPESKTALCGKSRSDNIAPLWALIVPSFLLPKCAACKALMQGQAPPPVPPTAEASPRPEAGVRGAPSPAASRVAREPFKVRVSRRASTWLELYFLIGALIVYFFRVDVEDAVVAVPGMAVAMAAYVHAMRRRVIVCHCEDVDE